MFNSLLCFVIVAVVVLSVDAAPPKMPLCVQADFVIVDNGALRCRHVLVQPAGDLVLTKWDPAIALSVVGSSNRHTITLANDLIVDDLVLIGVDVESSTNSTLFVTKRLTVFDCTVINATIRVNGTDARATVADSSVYTQHGPAFVGVDDSSVVTGIDGFCNPYCLTFTTRPSTTSDNERAEH